MTILDWLLTILNGWPKHRRGHSKTTQEPV